MYWRPRPENPTAAKASMPRKTPRTKTPAPERVATCATEGNLRLDQQLCFPLHLASRLVVNAYRPLLADLGVTYAQYLVLLVLWEEDGLSVGAIGERLHLDSGTLTPLLKRMVKQGLVERRRNGGDDRVVENWLSTAAKRMNERAQSIPVQMLCNAQLDLDDVASMKSMLERLIARLLPLQGGV
jgi:DNA-binding MarR family transcriptional regulator